MYLEECKDYREILTECFSADDELVNIHHLKAGEGLDACVDSTIETLATYKDLDFKFNSIHTEEGDLFGFVGVEITKDHGPHLITFFIMPRFRNKHYIKTFWIIVQELIGPEFFSGLYSKNTKAHNFFERAGAKEIMRSDNTVIYKFNILCH